MKIAIIGTGISGLTCAHLLHEKHQITVFERDDRIGGHTATKHLEVDGEQYAVDTGFIVYNEKTYPNFIRLMDQLGVASKPTEMSFSVTHEGSGIEYGGSNIPALFAQRKNWFSPRHWLMLKEIFRFNREAIADFEQGTLQDGLSLGEYLDNNNYSQHFRSHYLIPMGSAIWSTSLKDMMEMPALFFVRFFKNHGLLQIKDRPQWRVLVGGSNSYLQPLTTGFKDSIRLNSKIKSVTRTDGDAVITFEDGLTESFDQVVFACHSNQALALLADPTADEQQVLGDIPYADNDVVLHTDTSLLPEKHAAWSSWNYRVAGDVNDPPVLNYNMNILQGIDSQHTFVVTLNATDRIDPQKILGRFNYAHPQFNLKTIEAQNRWNLISGVNRYWFCGAYWRNGFHEDGCVSGIKVAKGLGADWELSDA